MSSRSEPAFGPNALFTPANGVTLLRMLATPSMLLLIGGHRFELSTLLLWIALCSTDGADGFLARRYGITRSGAFLDPLADKFLVLGAMVVLVVDHVFWWLPVAAITVREVGMSVYRSVVGRKGVSIPARRSAKWKTFVQQLAVGFAIAPWVGIHATWTAQVLLAVATFLTLWSGAQYLVDARRRVRSAS